MEDTIEDRARAAETIALEAADLARALFTQRDRLDVRLKGAQEHVTYADHAVEDLIVGRLGRLFPADGFVAEEGSRAPGAGLWVVDPIDGTANYAHGIPHFGVSIAFVREGRVEIGVVAAPMLRETFVAVRGRGARCGSEPMRVSDASSLRNAHIEVGWNMKDRTAEFTRTIAALAAEGAGVIRAGSAALALAYVAAGRLDGYCEQHVYAWDALAGVLLVEEAGGVANAFLREGVFETGGPILAAPRGVYAALGRASGIV